MRLRLTLRGLLRAPAFALASIGTIALAVSLSTTVFAVVDGVLFKPLPYPQADELFTLGGRSAQGPSGPLSPGDLAHLRTAVPDVPIASFGNTWMLSDPADPKRRLIARRVDARFFDVLGRRPLVGGFTDEDFRRPALSNEPTPALVSHRFWLSQMAADRSVLGSVIDIPQRAIRVVGVLPRDFVFPSYRHSAVDLIFPMPEEWAAEADRWSRGARVVLRIDAQRLAEAKHRYDAALAATVSEYGPPPEHGEEPYDRVAIEPLSADLGVNERPFFRLAFAGAALLVVIACVNVTGLLLARTRARARELRVRVALGAGRRDITMLVLGEVAAVSVLGAAAGLLLVSPALSLARPQLPEDINLLKTLAVDWRVVLFAFGAPLASMLLLAAVPIRRAFDDAPLGAVSPGSTPAAGSRTASALLALESGIGMALIVTGSFVLASFTGLRQEPVGMATEGRVLVDLIVRTSQETLEERAAIQDRALARIAAVPGVRDAALVGGAVFENVFSGLQIDPPAHVPGAWVVEVPVSPSFFEIAGLTLEEGRLPTRAEIEAMAPVAVMSRSAAREIWGEASAIGRVVTSGENHYTVIGVVQDVRLASQREGRVGEVFTPLGRSERWYAAYLLRVDGDAADAAASVRDALARDVPGVLVERAEPVEAAIAGTVKAQRFQASLFGIAGGAAALLLAVGVAGIVATSVRRRWREAGIRSALGASGGRIVRMLVADHLRPAALGIALGLVASWWMKEALRSLLYQLEPGDLRLWAAASALVVLVVVIAAWLPARRAAHADPAMVLRAE